MSTQSNIQVNEQVVKVVATDDEEVSIVSVTPIGWTETDPVFMQSEASKFVDGDKDKLDALTESNLVETDPIYTADKSTLALKTEIPTKVSQIQNDSNFITSGDIPAIPTKLSDLTDDATHRVVTDTEKNTWSGKQNALGYTAESTSNKGQISGYAGLDETGKVPSAQLPSYVDDVLEFANLAGFPTTGEVGKIYVALDTNLTYRWSGTVYTKIATGDVASVNSKTGAVVLSTDDIGDVATKRYTNDTDVSRLANTSGTNTGDQTIPTKLSDLTEDTTHRVVTDSEKSTWNGKQEAGDYATNTALGNKVNKETNKGLSANDLTDTLKSHYDTAYSNTHVAGSDNQDLSGLMPKAGGEFTSNVKFDTQATFDEEYNNGNSGTSKTIDWNNGNKQKITTTGSCTLTFTAPAGICNLVLRIVHEASSTAYIYTYPNSVKFPSGIKPATTDTSGAEDVLSLYWNGTNYYAVISSNFSVPA